MANDVFANGRELACKAGSGKVIAAFPDVCFTPPDKVPPTPPGVPIPYPLTSKASDTDKGTKKVVISKKPVMKRDSSNFKKCMGDEAAKTAKKGMINSNLSGKVIFTSWSSDIKIEGKNAVRHLDTLTSNHSSPNANAALPWPFLDAMAFSVDSDHPCKNTAKEVEEKCIKGKDKDGAPLVKKYKSGKVNRKATKAAMCANKKCNEALKCVLQEWKSDRCCDGKTPHHVVPKSQFYKDGFAGKKTRAQQDVGALLKNSAGKNKYRAKRAPCVCVEGKGHSGDTEHSEIHTETNKLTISHDKVKNKLSDTGKSISSDARWDAGDAESTGAKAVHEVTGCDEECTKSQVRDGHKKMGVAPDDKVRPTTAGEVSTVKVEGSL